MVNYLSQLISPGDLQFYSGQVITQVNVHRVITARHPLYHLIHILPSVTATSMLEQEVPFLSHSLSRVVDPGFSCPLQRAPSLLAPPKNVFLSVSRTGANLLLDLTTQRLSSSPRPRRNNHLSPLTWDLQRQSLVSQRALKVRTCTTV